MIVIDTATVLGKPDALHMSSDDVVAVHAFFGQRGISVDAMTDDEVRPPCTNSPSTSATTRR